MAPCIHNLDTVSLSGQLNA